MVKQRSSVTGTDWHRNSAPRTAPRQPSLGQPAGHCVGRVEDVGHIVADNLPEQMRCRHRAKPVVLLQPHHYLGGGMLQRLIKRTGVAGGEDVIGGFASRPGDRAPPFDSEPDGYREARFYARADDFAVTLAGVAVAEKSSAPGADTGNHAVVPGPKSR